MRVLTFQAGSKAILEFKAGARTSFNDSNVVIKPVSSLAAWKKAQ